LPRFHPLPAGLACLISLALALPAIALDILVVPPTPETPLTQLSLQGLANRAPQGPLVYITSDAERDAWLPLYRTGNQVTRVQAEDLRGRLAGVARGQVLYDPAQPYTVNIATTVAGVMGGVITDRDLGLPTLFDCRKRWPSAAEAYRWAIGTLLPTCSKGELALLPPDRAELRDYAVKQRLFVFDPAPDDPEVAGLLVEIARRLPSGARCYAVAAREQCDRLVALLSPVGHFLVPVSTGWNFSFHSSFRPTASLVQAERFYDLGTRLVTFVYAGGEDPGQALGLGRLLWDDPSRSQHPLGWTISPALLQLAPRVLQYYYARAQLDGNDYFLMAPNGPGLFYPSAAGHLELLGSDIADAARAAGLKLALITDQGQAPPQPEPITDLVTEARLRGAFLPPGSPLVSQAVKGVPVVRAALEAKTGSDDLLRALRKVDSNLIVVLLDPSRISPFDLASTIARMTPGFYTVVPPGQFVEAVRALMAMTKVEGTESRARISGLTLTPEQPQLGQPLSLRAEVASPDGAAWVQAAYSLPGRMPYTVTMTASPDGSYQADLPPLYWPGQWTFQVRVTDSQGATAWSEPLPVQVSGADGDRDGLADVLENYLLTDPALPDTDNDGLLDGNDHNFLTPDRPYVHYLYPITPPGDVGYLVEGAKLPVASGARQLAAGQAVAYRLSLAGLPPGAPAVLQVLATGAYTVEISGDGASYRPALESGEYPQGLFTHYLGGQGQGSQLFVRVLAREGQAAVWGISLTSPPDGPFITGPATAPQYPAPGLATSASAQAFDQGGIKEVTLTYRVNGGPPRTISAVTEGGSQVYQAGFPGLGDGDVVTYWMTVVSQRTAPGGGEQAAAAPVQAFRMGTSRFETISLLGGRDFEGAFEPGVEWGGNARWPGPEHEQKADSEEPGYLPGADIASIHPLAGSYDLHILAAPRGSDLEVLVDGKRTALIPGATPDGWQRAGSVRLGGGEHFVQVRSLRTPGGGRAGYAQVILTSDSRFRPTWPSVLDTYNSLSLLRPQPGATVSGIIEVAGTATGNVERVQFVVDSTVQRTASTPPYQFRWDSRQVKDGEHTLKLKALNRKGEELFSVEAPVQVQNGR